MKLRNALVAALLLVAQLPVQARSIHGSAGLGPAPNPSLSGVVIGDPYLFPFVNFMKEAADSIAQTSPPFIYPNFLLANSNLPNGTLPGTINYSVPLPSNYFGKYVLSMGGTVSGGSGFQLGGSGQIYSISGGTLSNCTNGNVPPCAFYSNVSISGTNPVVTMDYSTPITGAANNGSGLVRLTFIQPSSLGNGVGVTITGIVGSDGNGCGANGTFTTANITSTTVDLVGSTFPGGCTYTSGGQLFGYQQTTQFTPGFSFTSGATVSSMTSLIMCKLADYNADPTCTTTAGKPQWTSDGFNDDFVANLAAIKPLFIRYLDFAPSVFNVPADYNGWQTPSLWSYALYSYWVKTNWFGSDSGTNSYSISCSGSCTYTLTGGAPADGDYVQFYNVNANTASPTLTVTDANSVTSSAIPLVDETADQLAITIGGTPTTGDTIALKFTTTPLGAYTCLAGGQHTTSAYTVVVSDTIANIGNQLNAIAASDATLTALPANIISTNPNGSSGHFFIGYANNACTLTVSAIITGSATETVSVGTMLIGGMTANTLYTAIYSAYLKSFIINNFNPAGQAAGWPWTTQINLAKAVATKSGLQVGCWLQPNLLWSAASFTALANLVNANQCSGGSIFELSNEVWNPGNFETGQASRLANSLGLGQDFIAYYELRQRQLWAIASSIFGGLSGNLHTIGAFQNGGINVSEINGATLCGTRVGCSTGGNNWGYQNAIGVDYDSAPNRPIDYTRHLSQAPYYNGTLLSGGNYFSSASYGTWSATSSSVSGNVLTVSGTVTGTPIFWNQGISACSGVYLYAPTPSDPTSFQLTGKVTTTLVGSYNDQNTTYTVTSTSGLQVGMWIYDATNGMVNGQIGSINAGANQFTVGGATLLTYRTAGSSDTVVFGGLAGTYQLNSTSCSAASGTITGGDVLGLQYAADNYNGLNSALGSQQDALNWVYQDALVSVQKTNMQNTATVNSQANSYRIIKAAAAPTGASVWDYEGGYQPAPPSTSQATDMGLPSSAYGGAGYVNTLMTAFKNSAQMKTLETARHNNELAILPAGSASMWYAYHTLFQWALFPNTLYYPPPYKSYDAICDYNGGSC